LYRNFTMVITGQIPRFLKYLLPGYLLLYGLAGIANADSLSEAQRAHRTGNYSEAAKLYRLAAESGNADARYALGSMYTYGEGVTADYQKAEKWYRLAAEKGHRDAQYTLGLIYGSGQQGLAQDLQKAVKWYRLAAAQEHINALLNLGMIYERGYGQGIRRDYREAVKWYHLAAERGSSGAQAHLGIMYIRGFGVSRNLIRAYMWLELASDRGIGVAQQGRAEAAEGMSSSQIFRAKKMAANCRSRNYKNCD
jgi:TPR repeat protein